MTPRDWLNTAVTAAGAVLLAIGVIGLVGDDGTTDAAEPIVAATATPVEAEPTAVPTEEPAATATSEPSPTPEPTATTAPEPSPTPEPSATPQPEAETVEDFVGAFDNALATGDLDFLYDRLHPVAIEIGGTDACRAYVDTEFAAASALELTGAVTGPETVTKAGPDGPVEVPDRYTAEVALTFQGQVFAVVGEYALVDGEMRWFTPCA